MFQKNWQELIKPQKLKTEAGHDAGKIATITAEPLERGFGLTLGNSLRRVLLSSLQGAAVTSIQIEGVLHEFSSIQGVREDVTDIVLNVKQIALRMHAEGPKRVSLRASGPGEVKAGQIQGSSDIEILNPDLVLCTRHAASAGLDHLPAVFRGRRSVFWYFDAPSPLPEPVARLALLVDQAFATYGYQRDAFLALGARGAQFLPQGADPVLDTPAESAPAGWQCELSFVGSGQYPRRHAILAAFGAACHLQVRGPQWDNVPEGVPVVGGPVRGREFARAVRGAAVSLGVDALEAQRQERMGGTSNRIWRVLACGGVFLGEAVEEWEAVRDLVKAVAASYRIPYFTISPTFSVCPVHGYLSGKHFACPRCKEEKEARLREEIRALERELAEGRE